MGIKVAIVEDDAAVRLSLAGILKMERGLECVGEFGTAEEALRALAPGYPEVLLVDINLPGMDGVEFVRRVSEASPETKLIMLTVHDDTEAIFHSLEAGASGYLLKPARAAELVAAVKDVQQGGAPMTGNIARKVIQSFRRPGKPAKSAEEELTPREVEVLEYLSKGYLYKEVADRLHIGYATVHTHVARIYQKLHVQSRGQAVAKYRRL
jgi:DNA-binding NarL/FixJ family response regulator